MVIQHNLSALNISRNMNLNNRIQDQTLQRLSSGFRINSSADDAAGLSISEKFRLMITGTEQAERNVLEGLNLINISEGAMQEIHTMLNRAVELSSLSSNGIYGQTERDALQNELDQLIQDIDRVSNSINYNGKLILKGNEKTIITNEVKYTGTFPSWVTNTGGSLAGGQLLETFKTIETFQASDGTTQNYDIEHAAAKFDFSAYTGTQAQKDELKLGGFYTTCFTCSDHYSIQFVDGTGSGMTTSGNHNIYTVGIDNINTAEDLVQSIVTALDGGYPRRHFTKFTADPANAKNLIIYDDRSSGPNPILSGTTGSWNGWDNPNFNINPTNYSSTGTVGTGVATAVITTGGGSDITLQIGPTGEADNLLKLELADATIEHLGIAGISIHEQAHAQTAIGVFQNAIDILSNERGRMGAYQNRLEHTYNSLTNNRENMTQAESLIRDADMAKEMAVFVKSQLLAQASVTMLSQSNQNPGLILKLISQN